MYLLNRSKVPQYSFCISFPVDPEYSFSFSYSVDLFNICKSDVNYSLCLCVEKIRCMHA